MTTEEIRLRCVEFAVAQAKAENSAHNFELIAGLTEKYYALVVGGGSAEPDEKPKTASRGRPKKSPAK